MTELIELLSENNLTTLFITIILLCLAARGIVDFIEWVKKMLEKYHSARTVKEDEVEDMNARISSLDTRITRLEEMHMSQKEQLAGVNQKLDDMAELNRKQTIASFRSTLYRISEDIDAREDKHIHQIEYETFKDLADQYIALGGNHTMKDIIIPKIEDAYRKQRENS